MKCHHKITALAKARILHWWRIPEDKSRLWKLWWFFTRIVANWVSLSIILSFFAKWYPFAMALVVISAIGCGAFIAGFLIVIFSVMAMNLQGGPGDSVAWSISLAIIIICGVLAALAICTFTAFCIALIGGWLPRL